MHLKSLELTGFKSFAEAKIEFPSGVTSVVGPNGTGKSNVVDAMLWVLGEQSAKTLRSEKMEDVIFNGTEMRKPLGMAEVSLVMAGIDEERLKGVPALTSSAQRVSRGHDYPPPVPKRRQRILNQQNTVPVKRCSCAFSR